MPQVFVSELERRKLWRLAVAHGLTDVARALARECATERGLSKEWCPCHETVRAAVVV